MASIPPPPPPPTDPKLYLRMCAQLYLQGVTSTEHPLTLGAHGGVLHLAEMDAEQVRFAANAVAGLIPFERSYGDKQVQADKAWRRHLAGIHSQMRPDRPIEEAVEAYVTRIAGPHRPIPMWRLQQMTGTVGLTDKQQWLEDAGRLRERTQYEMSAITGPTGIVAGGLSEVTDKETAFFASEVVGLVGQGLSARGQLAAARRGLTPAMGPAAPQGPSARPAIAAPPPARSPLSPQQQASARGTLEAAVPARPSAPPPRQLSYTPVARGTFDRGVPVRTPGPASPVARQAAPTRPAAPPGPTQAAPGRPEAPLPQAPNGGQGWRPDLENRDWQAVPPMLPWRRDQPAPAPLRQPPREPKHTIPDLTNDVMRRYPKLVRGQDTALGVSDMFRRTRGHGEGVVPGDKARRSAAGEFAAMFMVHQRPQVEWLQPVPPTNTHRTPDFRGRYLDGRPFAVEVVSSTQAVDRKGDSHEIGARGKLQPSMISRNILRKCLPDGNVSQLAEGGELVVVLTFAEIGDGGLAHKAMDKVNERAAEFPFVSQITFLAAGPRPDKARSGQREVIEYQRVGDRYVRRP